jgi:phosphoribosylformylglycinamidine synthase
MGYSQVADVRQGKFFELALEDMDAAEARTLVEEVARKVLSNPVIESCRVELEDAAAGAPAADARAGQGGGA